MKRTSPVQELADAVTRARDALLGRYPKLPRTDPTYTDAVDRRAISALATADCVEEWRDVALRWEEPATAEDVTNALTLYREYCRVLNRDERLLIDMARRRGISWAEIARKLGLPDGKAAQRRHSQLVDQRWLRPIDPERAEPTP